LQRDAEQPLTWRTGAMHPPCVGTLSLPRHGHALPGHGDCAWFGRGAEKMRSAAPLLNRMGIATFAVDSFKPRSISQRR
jgi:hypothetical protein